MPPRLRHLALTILVCDDPGRAQSQVKQAFDDAHIGNVLKFVADIEHLLDYLHQRREFGGETGAAPRPGLMLVNLQSPGPEARGALADIRADDDLRAIPIIGLVASKAEEIAVRGLGFGVHTFIARPVTMPALLAAIRTLGDRWLELVERAPAPA